jgi:hypothetical protein
MPPIPMQTQMLRMKVRKCVMGYNMSVVCWEDLSHIVSFLFHYILAVPIWKLYIKSRGRKKGRVYVL